MSSLVTEILSSAGKLEKQEIGSKVEVLKEKIERVKTNVQEYVQKRYVEFLPSSVKTADMHNKLLTYDNEILSLSYVCENELSRQIDESADEFQEICNQLLSAKSALKVVNHLISIHEALQQCQASFQNNDFEESVNYLQKVAAYIKELEKVWKDQITLLSSLTTEYRVQNEKLKYDMGEIWKDIFKWTVIQQSGVGEGGEQIELALLKSSSIRLQGLVHAMQDVNYLQQNLQLFGKRLLQYVIEPIITKDTQIKVVEENERTTLNLTAAKTALQPPESVFNKLTTVFELLSNHEFGSVEVPAGDIERVPLIRRLGVIIYPDFCDILIKKCLSPSVPYRRQDLTAFDDIVNNMTNFHTNLTRIGIFQPDEKTLINYAKDVDCLFTNKLCQSLLADTRKLMLLELHKSILVDSTGTRFDDTSANKTSIQETQLEKKMANIFKFPACEISKSANDLVDVLHNIMEDATTSSSQCATRLVTTVRNILIMYCDIVTCYHKDSLETMPICSALFHNNCMYIAHYMQTIGQKFNSRLPPPLNCEIVTFIDLVPKLREKGVEVFLAQMKNQRKNLLNFLHEAGDFRNMATDDKFISNMERAVKQCMLHLEHLSRMWKNVLCSTVYTKSLGTLLNSVLEDITTQVTTVEDLSATHATQLIDIFDMITKRAQALFLVEESQEATVQVQRAVPKWVKFTEMVLVLNATLQTIVDRWANGKGPLAQEFSADEIKQMIRALFQNTDRRAAVLAKIK